MNLSKWSGAGLLVLALSMGCSVVDGEADSQPECGPWQTNCGGADAVMHDDTVTGQDDSVVAGDDTTGTPDKAGPGDDTGACTPSCDGLDCGGNGCGGSCGTCADGEDCVGGLCVGEPMYFCALKCAQPADCDTGAGGAYSADNYDCVEGFCQYIGCYSDTECAESFNNNAYGCN